MAALRPLKLRENVLMDSNDTKGAVSAPSLTGRPRKVVLVVAVVGMLLGVWGLMGGFWSIVPALRGAFDRVGNHAAPAGFYPAFWVLTSISIVCSVLLLIFCADLFRNGGRSIHRLTRLLWFELVYFLTPILAWRSHLSLGHALAAAWGVGNVGLGGQFLILYPVWALFALRWTEKKLEGGA
jgi:hypothetical protein